MIPLWNLSKNTYSKRAFQYAMHVYFVLHPARNGKYAMKIFGINSSKWRNKLFFIVSIMNTTRICK
jgi:hypothetical protein